MQALTNLYKVRLPLRVLQFEANMLLLCPTKRIKTTCSCMQLRKFHSSPTRYGLLFKPKTLNPIDELQQSVVVPLLLDNDHVFKPNYDDIKKSYSCFKSGRGKRIQVSVGATKYDQLPDSSAPEVGFIGRSNAGKSSLISALLYHPEGIKLGISAKPGRTRAVNFYKVHKNLCLVDMPGYGYKMPNHYVDSVEEYIKHRPQLQNTLCLVDGSVGLTNTDVTGIQMMEEFGKPYTLVMTKIDKASPHRIIKNYMALQEEKSKWMQCSFPQIFMVSAKQEYGLSYLRTFIAYLTSNLQLAAT